VVLHTEHSIATKGIVMVLAYSVWWDGGGIAVFFYFVLMVTLGIVSISKGHWVMFLIGLFLPIFWFIGALTPARR